MPISTRLADRVRRQAARLVREAGRARSGRVDGVHQARVASRRLREMLALAASVTDGDARSLARDAKRVGRVLGPLRELDVSSTVWREPRYEVPWAPTLLTRLDRAVERERSRLVPQMRTTIDRLAGARLLHRADTLASALVAANGDKAISAALVRSIRARSRALERAIDAAGTVYAHEALHEVRIAAKKFRYSLELVVEDADRGRAAAPHGATGLAGTAPRPSGRAGPSPGAGIRARGHSRDSSRHQGCCGGSRTGVPCSSCGVRQRRRQTS